MKKQKEMQAFLANIEQAAARYKDGALGDELAEEFGLTRETILRHLRAHGVEIRPRGGGLALADSRRALPKEDETEIGLLYKNGCTLAELSVQFDCGVNTVRRALRRQGISRRPGAPRPNSTPRRDRPPRKPRQRTASHYMQVWLPADDPYAAMCQSRGWVLEHRLVMAKHLGRPLTAEESVHHRNGKRRDNRIKNLELRQGKHGAGQGWRCADCGSQNLVAV